MDHCRAIRNAAQAGGPVGAVICVGDYIVHDERNMIIHQNVLVARGAADEEEDEEEEDKETKGHKKKKQVPPIS
jgi:predicted phosphodiesterase